MSSAKAVVQWRGEHLGYTHDADRGISDAHGTLSGEPFRLE